MTTLTKLGSAKTIKLGFTKGCITTVKLNKQQSFYGRLLIERLTSLKYVVRN